MSVTVKLTEPDSESSRARLTMKLNDSRNAKFPPPRFSGIELRRPIGFLPVRSHLASRVMAVDNGFPTYEDNARIYRFYAALTSARLRDSRTRDESVTYSRVAFQERSTSTISLASCFAMEVAQRRKRKRVINYE